MNLDLFAELELLPRRPEQLTTIENPGRAHHPTPGAATPAGIGHPLGTQAAPVCEGGAMSPAAVARLQERRWMAPWCNHRWRDHDGLRTCEGDCGITLPDWRL